MPGKEDASDTTDTHSRREVEIPRNAMRPGETTSQAIAKLKRTEEERERRRYCMGRDQDAMFVKCRDHCRMYRNSLDAGA